ARADVDVGGGRQRLPLAPPRARGTAAHVVRQRSCVPADDGDRRLRRRLRLLVAPRPTRHLEPVMSPHVLTTDLTKRYRQTTAVDGIDLDVVGGVTGVLGPNGSGKSTLLQMLATVLRPDRGTIAV